MKRFQSWVFCGTKLKTCSAAIIPASHEAWVLLNVVMKMDPLGFNVSTQAFKNKLWSTTCSNTSLATTASYFSWLHCAWFSIVSQTYSMLLSKSFRWSRAVDRRVSDGSSAVTLALSLPKASVRIPAPHPTSRIFIPCRTFLFLILSSFTIPVDINPSRISGTLTLLYAWRPFIGPFGSHHSLENSEWCATSVKFTFSTTFGAGEGFVAKNLRRKSCLSVISQV